MGGERGSEKDMKWEKEKKRRGRDGGKKREEGKKNCMLCGSIYGTYTTAMCFLGLELKGRLTDKEPQQHSGQEQTGMTVTQCIDCQIQPRVV